MKSIVASKLLIPVVAPMAVVHVEPQALPNLADWIISQPKLIPAR